MALTDEDPLTELTEIHQKAIKKLEKLGYQVMEEVRFPPYVVDIYIPDLHIGVEVDGPHHVEKRDIKRDNVLYEEYNLPIIRLNQKESTNSALIKRTMKEAVKLFQESASIRFDEIQDKVPWL